MPTRETGSTNSVHARFPTTHDAAPEGLVPTAERGFSAAKETDRRVVRSAASVQPLTIAAGRTPFRTA